MSIYVFRIAALLVLSLVSMSCGPSILVVHRDPQYPRVKVEIDGRSAGTLEYGDDTSVSVDAGRHEISVVPEGSSTSPWTENGKGVTVWVEKEAIFTLLPRNSEVDFGIADGTGESLNSLGAQGK